MHRRPDARDERRASERLHARDVTDVRAGFHALARARAAHGADDDD